MLTLKEQLIFEIHRDYKYDSKLSLILDVGTTYPHIYILNKYDEIDIQIFISSKFKDDLSHIESEVKIIGWDIIQGENNENDI